MSYVIAKNKGRKAFFTTASSYDRPQWVAVKEAKVYTTAELAESAAKKLYKYGAYEARIMTLNEAIQLELPPEEDTRSAEDDAEREMVAIKQSADPEVDPSEVETSADVDMEAQVDTKLGIADQADRAAIDSVLDAESDAEGNPQGNPDDEFADPDTISGEVDPFADPQDINGAEQVAGGPDGAPITRVGRLGQRYPTNESATMPPRREGVAKPEENDKTAVDVKMPEVIKYKDKDEQDPALTSDDGSKGETEDEKVRVPANVLSELRAAIAKHEKEVKQHERDEIRASFSMTVVDAFKAVLEQLEMGTVASIKCAQICMTSWMSPITALLPASVIKFVTSGGRSLSLKERFNEKRGS